MDALLLVPTHSSIMIRAQKIRERMLVEMMYGIPPANKDAFLALCCQYELKFVATELAASIATEWKRRDNNNWTNWSDWTDWFKLGTRR